MLVSDMIGAGKLLATQDRGCILARNEANPFCAGPVYGWCYKSHITPGYLLGYCDPLVSLDLHCWESWHDCSLVRYAKEWDGSCSCDSSGWEYISSEAASYCSVYNMFACY